MIVMRVKIMLFCCMLSLLRVCAEELPGGLLFTSSKEKIDKRTSLVLFGDKFQKFEDTFSVSFDLSIWDSGQFGHIFRVINNRKQEVEFVFVNFYGIDKMYLDFHSPITHKSVQIPVTQQDIDKKTILHFDIKFDLQSDKASIALRDTVYVCEPVGLENPSQLQFAFGLYGLNLDVPQMLIKNLRINAEKGKMLFFPLDEPEGEFAYDATGKIAAPVKNPEWIVNKHFYWQAKTRFTVKNKADIAYDEANNRILIAGNDSALCFYPRYDILQRYKPNSDSVFTDNRDESNLLHSNIFLSEAGDKYRFGGYCNHSYSSQISLYNRETCEWETVTFTGNTITPRFHSAVGDGIGQDEKLLFGGFGNETGRQEHGGHNLYDLHILNLKQKTITRLWSIQEIPKIEFIPGNNLILSNDKKYFYALCYAHYIPKTLGYLYRFDLQNGTYDVISDSIGFTSEDMNTSVNLFYNRQMNEFYAVICDLSDTDENRVQIYSLLSPPIMKVRLENSIRSQKLYGFIIASVAALLILLTEAYILWQFACKKKKDARKNRPIETSPTPLGNKPDRKEQKQSAAYIFGSFTVYDRKGTDISYRFSIKLKTLFSLVLLNTNGETGISTENLTLALWPNKDVNSSKSIRGVTINRLRGILEDIDGISLVHQNHQWFFVFEQPFYCDWLEYSDILRSLLTTEKQDLYAALMERLLSIVCDRKFLVSVQDSAIDSYKSKEDEKLEQLLREYIVHLYDDKQYRRVISVAPVFFMIEPLNDKILNICIKSYNKLGKKNEAKFFLKNYKRTHQMLTGEEYGESDAASRK